MVGLRERGLDVTKPVLVVIDGDKALASAVKAVFDHPVIQRCQLHKLRNIEDHLPDHVAATVAKKVRAAYYDTDALNAQATLEALAKDLDKSHPGAAGSLRDGLAETLTIGRLGVPPTLARTLRSTNPIVILSQPEGVHHVADGPQGSTIVRRGRGYLEPSSTQAPGRFDVRPAGGVARLVA